jgi:hypothetical protein
VTGPFVWDAANNIYYIELDWSADSIYGKRDVQFALIAAQASDYARHWDPTNDWSHQGLSLSSTAVGDTQYMPVYLNGVKVYGQEPPVGGATVTPGPSLTPTRTTVALTATRTNTPLAITLTPTRTSTALAITLTPTRTSTAPAITNTPTRTATIGITNTPTRTATIGITNTPSRTSTALAITLTPTRTSTTLPVNTLTVTPTVVIGVCSPVTSTIAAPFTYDGAGAFCWQSSNLGAYINSWNLTSLTVNGVSFTNLYVAVGSYPAKIGGYWYVSYNSTSASGHFEAK